MAPDTTATAPGAPPRTDRQGRRRIRPTGYGWVFMAVLLGMLWGSSNYNNNLGFAMAFLCAGVLFTSTLHTHAQLKAARIAGVRARPVFAGEEAMFEVTVAAEDRPARSLRLAFAGGRSDMVDVDPGQRRRARLAVPAERRGWLRPGPLLLATDAPLGLFRAWTWREVQAECLVYPAPTRGGVPLGFGRTHVEEGEEAGPGVDDFHSLRPYRPGDPMQRIAWKASSRGQGLMTKEFEGRFGSTALLDWDLAGPGGVEDRLSRLCAMVLAAHARRMTYGLRLPGVELPPDAGQPHKAACLKALALYRLPEGAGEA